MSILYSIFLGFIQGAAEFLPISSSGHLSIIQNFFTHSDVEHAHMFFDVLLHLGTLLAVILIYRKDIWEMIKEFFRWIGELGSKKASPTPVPPARRLILLIVIATLPLILILPIKDMVEGLYYNTIFIGCALIATGFILFLSDRCAKGRKDERTVGILSTLFIGIAQAIAVVPGLSRSGITISAATFAGCDRGYAVRFSFLLSLPAVLGANLISLIDAVKDGIDPALIPIYLGGMASAFVFGCLAIGLVNFIVKKGKFGAFSWYCWAAGAATVIYSLIA